MARYSKLIAALLGNIVAIVLAWLATQFPGVAECSVTPDVGEICSVLGFTQVQITAALMLLVNGLFVYQSPANAP